MLARIAKLLLIQQPLPGPGLLFASGLVKPVDGTKGYRTGCFFQHTDGAANTACYINEGSVTSCLFQAIAASGSELLSDSADVGVTDYTAGSILVADGDSWEEVAVSGQATLAATGALTIPLLSATLGVVTASKAVLVDGSKDISAFRTVGCVNLDCGSAVGAGVGGTLDIYSATTAKGRMAFAYVDALANNSLLITNDQISGSDKTATFTNTTGKVVLSTAALTCAEVDVLGSVTPGTAAASKALVLGAASEIATITTLTATTINNTTLNSTSIDAGSAAGGTAGSVDIFPVTAAAGKLTVTSGGSTGDFSITLTTALNDTSAKTVTIPALTGYVALSTATLALAEVDVLQDVTPGAAAASKAVVLNSASHIDTLKMTALWIGASGSATQVTATAAELNVLASATAGDVVASKAVITDAYKGIRFGEFATAGATTGQIALADTMDHYADGQVDVLAIYGASTADLGAAHSAKLARFRHMVNCTAAAHEVYGAVGQLVIKDTTLTHLGAGLMGTLEGHTSGVVLNSSYTIGHGCVIARLGGHAAITATTPVAGFLAFNNGTAALAGAASKSVAFATSSLSATYPWKIGMYSPVGSVLQGIRIGDWVGSGASGSALSFTSALDLYGDGQLDLMGVYGESTADLTAAYSAKCARFRHIATGTALTINHETYGAIGQLVVKGTTLGHLHAGLMGTLEGHTSGAVANGAYEHGIGAIIARVGGGAAIAATKSVSGVIAFWNGAALGTAGAGSNAFSTCDTGDGLWTTGLAINRATNAFAFPASGTAPVAAGAYAVGGGTMVRISVLVGGVQYYMLASTEPKADAIE